jgi:hypothetical protein
MINHAERTYMGPPMYSGGGVDMHDMHQRGSQISNLVADMKWLALDQRPHHYKGHQHPTLRGEGERIRRTVKDCECHQMPDGSGILR